MEKKLAIQMVDLKSQYLDIKPDIDLAIQQVVDEARFINGPIVQEFSSALSEWNNSRYVIPCANGTDGLQIALMALELEPGDEIIVPAFTYIATVEVICLLGLKPVFVDVDYKTFNINIDKVEAAITPKTRAIMPVHLYGQCAEMDPIIEVAERKKLFVIEDLAQALGAKYKGTNTGNLGHIGVTSFFPSKNLGCYGDGGALFTNDESLASKIKCIANHGQSKKYYHDQIGVNSRLDSIQAAILNEKLKHLYAYQQRRGDAAKFYFDNLADVDYIQLPTLSNNSSHVYHQFTLKVEPHHRDKLADFLKDRGIPSMIYYPLPIPRQAAYNQFEADDIEVSERLSTEVLSLPMHTHLQDEQLSYICESIKKYAE